MVVRVWHTIAQCGGRADTKASGGNGATRTVALQCMQRRRTQTHALSSLTPLSGDQPNTRDPPVGSSGTYWNARTDGMKQNRRVTNHEAYAHATGRLPSAHSFLAAVLPVRGRRTRALYFTHQTGLPRRAAGACVIQSRRAGRPAPMCPLPTAVHLLLALRLAARPAAWAPATS